MTYRLVVIMVRSALRKILDEATSAIARMVPMDIQASETRCLDKKRRMNRPEKDTEFRKAGRCESLKKME